MDGLDIFDLSTEELVQELAAIGHEPTDESVRWRCELILQELQDRQGYEDLAGQLQPLQTADNPGRQSPRAQSSFEAQPLAVFRLLDQESLRAWEAPAGVEVTPAYTDRVLRGARRGIEEEEGLEDKKQDLEKEFLSEDRVRVSTVKSGAFELKSPRGSRTERGPVLREIVIGSCPVGLSPRRRSSQRRLSTSSDTQVRLKTQPERDKAGAKAVRLRTSTAKAKGITFMASKAAVGQPIETKPQRKVSSSKKSVEAVLGWSGRVDLEVANAACSAETSEQLAPSSLPEEALLDEEVHSQNSLASRDNDATRPVASTELFESAEAKDLASSREEPAQGLEPAQGAHTERNERMAEQDGGAPAIAGLEQKLALAVDERGIEVDDNNESPREGFLPLENTPNPEAVASLAESSPIGAAASFEEAVTSESFSDVQASTSNGDCREGVCDPVAAWEDEEVAGSLLARNQGQNQTVSPLTSGQVDEVTISQEQTALPLDSNEVAPACEHASAALSNNAHSAVSQGQSRLRPLTRFEQIFARYAPGTGVAKETGSKPGPALQHFYQEVAQSLEADAQLACALLEGKAVVQTSGKAPDGVSKAPVSGERASDHPILRCDAGEHVEVADLMTSFGRTSDTWAVDTASESSTWNVMWTWCARPRVDFSELLVWQKLNHFPHSKHLTRKDLLKGHLTRHSRAAIGLMPTTFTLPREYVAFVRAFSDGRTEITDPSEKASEKATKGDEGLDETSLKASNAECNNLWIMKPVGKSRGQGIFLVSDIRHVAYGEAMVVQKYVERPLLIHGHKFDLRLYVMVTSVNPLEAFLYQEGFARFASRPYTQSEASLTDMLVHLTNTEVQKDRDHVPNFLLASASQRDTCLSEADLQRLEKRSIECWEDCRDRLRGKNEEPRTNLREECLDEDDPPRSLVHPEEISQDSEIKAGECSGRELQPEQLTAATEEGRSSQSTSEASTSYASLDGGCKVSLSRAFALMTAHGVDVDRLWRKIANLVLQSLEAVQIAIPADRNCFEMFGYDVLVDEQHRPWLVEVNSSPSMETGTPLDRALKGALIRDTLHLLDPVPFDRNSLASALRRRSIPQPSVKRADGSTLHDPDLLPDLERVLKGKQQRRFGELPAHLGNYQRIAPPIGSQKRAGR